MDLTNILERFDDERRHLEFPDIIREATDSVVRHISRYSTQSAIVYSSHETEELIEAISDQLDYFRSLGHDFEWKTYSHNLPRDHALRNARSHAGLVGDRRMVGILQPGSRIERFGGVLLMIAALFATRLILHESLGTAMNGLIFVMYATPLLSLAFVVWAATSRSLDNGLRRATMIATILLACSVWALFRMDGMTGGDGAIFEWRWTETHEERLLALGSNKPTALSSLQTPAETGTAWSGFRGPHRDGVIHDSRIDIDLTTSAPVDLWHRPVGPGWSSFAVRGNLFYTQEQRGDAEIVACYNLTTGKPVWSHSDKTRFWEAIGGAGPRATPTLSDGIAYAFGGTGILNALDASNGQVVWSRNVAADTYVEVPTWGFSSSPLVVDDIVIVAAAATLAAYDIVSGDQKWVATNGNGGYSSPHLATIDGVRQILLMSSAGVSSVSLTDGAQL
jgi:hypothetical protein